MAEEIVDFLIIGSGPSGAAASLELGGYRRAHHAHGTG